MLLVSSTQHHTILYSTWALALLSCHHTAYCTSAITITTRHALHLYYQEPKSFQQHDKDTRSNHPFILGMSNIVAQCREYRWCHLPAPPYVYSAIQHTCHVGVIFRVTHAKLQLNDGRIVRRPVLQQLSRQKRGNERPECGDPHRHFSCGTFLTCVIAKRYKKKSPVGLEPTASRLTVPRSNQLSYGDTACLLDVDDWTYVLKLSNSIVAPGSRESYFLENLKPHCFVR